MAISKQKDALCRLAYVIKQVGLFSTADMEEICGYSPEQMYTHINRGEMLFDLEKIDIKPHITRAKERMRPKL